MAGGGAPAFEEEREATRCRGSGGDLCRSKRVRSHASAASERQSARVTIAERAIGAQVGDTGAFSPFSRCPLSEEAPRLCES